MLVNEEDPVKARLVDDRINALLAQANLVIARRIAAEGGNYLDLLIDGGEFDGARPVDRDPRPARQRPHPRSAAAGAAAGAAARLARPR